MNPGSWLLSTENLQLVLDELGLVALRASGSSSTPVALYAVQSTDNLLLTEQSAWASGQPRAAPTDLNPLGSTSLAPAASDHLLILPRDPIHPPGSGLWWEEKSVI